MLRFYCKFDDSSMDGDLKIMYNGEWYYMPFCEKLSLKFQPEFRKMVGTLHMQYDRDKREARDFISGKIKKVKRIKFKDGDELCFK
jgi:hypothetical protein